jgi:hypothetical protein
MLFECDDIYPLPGGAVETTTFKMIERGGFDE